MSIHVDVVNIYVSSPEILAEIRSLVRNTPIKVHTLDKIEKEESKFTQANIEKRFDQIIAESEEADKAVEREEGAKRFYDTVINPEPENKMRKVGRPKKTNKLVIEPEIEIEVKTKKKRELSYQNFTARICKQCQKEFMPTTVKQQYCSKECFGLLMKEKYKK